MDERFDKRTPPLVLSFAASDPSGGAGVQADLLTIGALGCHPLSVITALTVQDTVGVSHLLPVDPAYVEQQARGLLMDMPVAACKVGLTGSVDNIAAIARVLAEHPHVPVVVDPVLASGRGDPLADEKTIDALFDQLFPLATLLTPNTLEAKRLARTVLNEEPSGGPAQAQPLLTSGCEYVLLTGTHATTEQVENTLFRRGHGLLRRDCWPRLADSYHGSGCTLASAIAAFLGRGSSVVDAVYLAQAYTWRTLAAGFRPGRGQHIPNRFFASSAPMVGER